MIYTVYACVFIARYCNEKKNIIMMWKNVPATNKKQQQKTKINNIFLKLIQQYPLESAYPGLVTFSEII